jgi:superfamily II DNA/RNA helicase
MDGLDAMGFRAPTPIQQQAIPAILDHYDLIACAQTGTGKTAAYLLPVIDKILNSNHSHLNTLILVPTRELAQQIDQQLEGFSYYVPISSIAVYGGGDGNLYTQQQTALRKGADIIIATPGRLIGHLASGNIDFSKLQHLILDEADRMLDMGFYDDIIKIISYLPKDRQTLLFSATMPPRIKTLASKILFEPKEISIAISKPAAGIKQMAYMTYEPQKLGLLSEIFKVKYQSVIVFASTKEKVKSLQFEFKKIGIPARPFHSDLEQKDREELMNEFRNRKVQVLIGTDILSRGIDVDGIDLVINFDVPPDPEDYVHRIGRTARAETTGTAITFINEKDMRRFHAIERLIEREIEKSPLPAELGTAPLYEPLKKRPPMGGGRPGSKPNSNHHYKGRKDKPRN